MPVKAPHPVPGKVFGELCVLKDAPQGINKNGTAYNNVWCLCNCGREIVVRVASLHSGNTKSCGCFQRLAVSKQFTKHGYSDSSTYRIWTDIKQRCLNPKNPTYKKYGAKGITICAEWLDFQNFVRDVGLRPSNNLSLDRIDNKKGYFPGNCRWATRVEQQNNRDCNTIVELEGEKTTLAQAARKANIKTLAKIYEKMRRDNCTLQESFDFFVDLQKRKTEAKAFADSILSECSFSLAPAQER